MIEHRTSNVSHLFENIVHAQPNVSHKKDKIQNLNFEYAPSKQPSEDPQGDDRKQAAKR